MNGKIVAKFHPLRTIPHTNCSFFFFLGGGGVKITKPSRQCRQDVMYQKIYGSFNLKLSPHSAEIQIQQFFQIFTVTPIWGHTLLMLPTKKNIKTLPITRLVILVNDGIFTLLSDYPVQISNNKKHFQWCKKILSNQRIADHLPIS